MNRSIRARCGKKRKKEKFFVVITMKAFLGYSGKKKKIKVMKFFEERECACVRKRGRERMRVCMREKG